MIANSLVDAAESFDVVVYGATPGGVSAAVAAARHGDSVALVDPDARLGGLLTSGLSQTDAITYEGLSGFFRTFCQRVETHYRARYGADSTQLKASFRGMHGEPGVNLRVLEAMIAEQPTLKSRQRHELVSVRQGPREQGRTRLTDVTFETPQGRITLAARVFIDATYEGDLMAMAGESYHVGREARAHYGESLAGDGQGAADGQVQGYNFRYTMTREASNRVTPRQPVNYRREEFLPVLEQLASGKINQVFVSGFDGIFRFHDPGLPNRKYDINDAPGSPVRLSLAGHADEWPEGARETRQRIFAEHHDYQLGLLWFLQNDPAVPEAFRLPAREWGFCRDEFTETDHLPPRLYIREARRLVGQFVYTQCDTAQATGDARAQLHPDSIAVLDYMLNSHGTGHRGPRYGGEHTGQFFQPIAPSQVPYGVMVPRLNENLLVPVACSASHVGFCALRYESDWCKLGEAAGEAAHLAIKNRVPVQQVPVAELQAQLHQAGAMTIYLSDVSPDDPDFAAAQWLGTIGGFHGLTPTKTGPASTSDPRTPDIRRWRAGHQVTLDAPLEDSLKQRWLIIGAKAGAAATQPSAPPETRRQFLRQLYLATHANMANNGQRPRESGK
ncbi:FAD-dependent oxidoreductase [Singulisphaera sp. Ch08]|uniref:FAD-dependent oxidoreductase n=1 Tax=Singulisphaera sp. Ch08 TaxID=3120278 RepID=UPI0038730CFD